jgi:hypothetical protein
MFFGFWQVLSKNQRHSAKKARLFAGPFLFSVDFLRKFFRIDFSAEKFWEFLGAASVAFESRMRLRLIFCEGAGLIEH